MGKKRKNNEEGKMKIDRDDRIEFNGVVEESLPGTWFNIRTDLGNMVLATLSGKMRQNHIHILPGDRVTVEVSPYDLTRGRVTWRQGNS